MGGCLPTHIVMIFYSGFQYFFVYKSIECDDPKVKISDIDDYGDLLWMMCTHILSIFLFIIKKKLKSRDDNSAYWKQFLTVVYMAAYMTSIPYIQFRLLDSD